ncbi:hypothetical protein [Jannaschia donghaensis]|uniref:Efflux transporter, RND family, MFP subunit n=1 Tax=Jannaschia donghaensis TaxID=420998 RepID=A0A0M6YL17_9RHOB|nr:hypothetical protein [Jannaschia donghaensis]CTQ50620.1 efflux transporter, RND family, MFP subunit [Jannaschia donghaensis]
MITKLKRRPRSDSFDREATRPRRRWDRGIYLALLAMFAAAMLDYVAGDLVFLRADGLVLRDRSVVAATTLIRVNSVDIVAGQSVREGDPLLQASSVEVLDRLADLSMRDAELAEREAELRSRKDLSERLMPLARDRAEALDRTRDTLDASITSGLVTATRREGVVDQAHLANVELVTLVSRAEGLGQELEALGVARQQARDALDDLATLYDGGFHRAGTSGVIGDSVPAPGEVFNPGEPILTVLSGKPYVLAYLPTNYLFRIRQGDRITVSAGTLTQVGTIDRILSVSQSIPDEFRNAFRVDERRQLARIALDEDGGFPTFSAVRVARESRLPDWREAIVAAARYIPGLSGDDPGSPQDLAGLPEK